MFGINKEDFINIKIPKFDFGFFKPKKKDILKEFMSNPSNFIYTIDVTSEDEIHISIKRRES